VQIRYSQTFQAGSVSRAEPARGTAGRNGEQARGEEAAKQQRQSERPVPTKMPLATVAMLA
jgi:hypothetical protein